MRKLLLIIALVNSCNANCVIAMTPDKPNDFSCSQKAYDIADFDNTDEWAKKIQQEETILKFDTMESVLEAAENGNEKAFKVIQKLLDEQMCGLFYSVAVDLHEKKFVSSSMTEILLKNEDVQDALNEIQNFNEVERIILEGTGTNNYWIDVLKDAKNGDDASLSVIMELLEKRYLLDLPFIIAQCLGRGIFNEEMETLFFKNASVQKALNRLATNKIPGHDDPARFFI